MGLELYLLISKSYLVYEYFMCGLWFTNQRSPSSIKDELMLINKILSVLSIEIYCP